MGQQVKLSVESRFADRRGREMLDGWAFVVRDGRSVICDGRDMDRFR